MLQRIIAIRNVGRFRNCAAQGDVTLRRFTLIFSENARGKTTLCAILRSLFTNNPALIIGRATLGSPDPPEVQFLFAGDARIDFRNRLWSAAYPDIAVFDGAYISENVFAGDFVDTDHRRNLYRVIIGAQGVALNARIVELDADIRAKNDQIRLARAQLQQHHAGMSVEQFLALPEDTAIDEKITAKQQELQAAQQSAQLQQRPPLESLIVPLFDPGLAEVLGKSLPNIAADAERQVTEHVAAHDMLHRGGEPWLTQGLGYATESCPFCGQALQGVVLIKAYQDYFNREYLALREQVNRHRNDIDEAFGERMTALLEQTLLRNANDVEFWKAYCPLEAPILPEGGRTAEIVAGLRRAALGLLDRKVATPLEAIPADEALTQALASVDALRESVHRYNEAVAAANALIAVRKQQARNANSGAILQALNTLKAQKARHIPEMQAACDADATRQGEKAALDQEKTQTRERLDAHTAAVIAHYGDSINTYLDRINAGFRITAPTHNYRGGTPMTTYQIVINQRAVDLGDASTPLDRPSFRNTLSAGDRSTLALAFFLAELEQDAGRARKVVVFDDPFTSLDAFRRNQTVHQICRCAETCAQVVVLSHDPGFLKLLWDRIAPAERKPLQLVRIGEDNTTIAEWDIERAVQQPYRADIDTLQRYFTSAQGDPRDVIQKIRPVVESYCRHVCPTQFANADGLGEIIAEIRSVGPGHPLAAILDELEELNQYARRYHHGENPNAENELVNDAELTGYVRQTLRIVGGAI